MKVGIVGAGAISGAYLRTLARLPQTDVVGVADLDVDRARAAAGQLPHAQAMTLDQLLAGETELVLNLTTPAAHAGIARAAVAAGKHVYGEKPLTASMDSARQLLDEASQAGVRVGCAPDTVLGTGVQTARRAIADGLIGTPVAASATMGTPGHELWHPDPEFYYLPGGGPLLDMGPYYLTALVHLLGPVRRVTAASGRPRPVRTIGTGPRAGTTFESTVDTHISGTLEHHGGALSTVLMSFDIVATTAANLEVHGTQGSLVVPDPNTFDGTPRIRGLRHDDWSQLPASAGYLDAGRGYGVAELIQAQRSGVPHRASADIAYHVLDICLSLLRAARDGIAVAIESTCAVPPIVPLSGSIE